MIMEIRETSGTRISKLRPLFYTVRFLDLMRLSMVDWEMLNLPSIVYLFFALLTNSFLVVPSFNFLPITLAVFFAVSYVLQLTAKTG